MTSREYLAMIAFVAGTAAALVAAASYDGWRAAVAVAAVLLLTAAVLLGLEDTTEPVADAAELGLVLPEFRALDGHRSGCDQPAVCGCALELFTILTGFTPPTDDGAGS